MAAKIEDVASALGNSERTTVALSKLGESVANNTWLDNDSDVREETFLG